MSKYAPSGAGTNRRPRQLMYLIAGLIGLNMWLASKRQVGPDPALEALHSPQEAISQCQAAIVTRFASESPTIRGLLAAEYLQGGEYEVRGAITLGRGLQQARSQVVCVAQFSVSAGWDAEEIYLEPS